MKHAAPNFRMMGLLQRGFCFKKRHTVLLNIRKRPIAHRDAARQMGMKATSLRRAIRQ